MVKSELKLPAVDPLSLEEHSGTFYPDAVKGPAEARRKRRLGDADKAQWDISDDDTSQETDGGGCTDRNN
mgnify:CR=1 FL=1